jgi:3',5'-cyclic AMP phosphodiesterase CpdA
VPLYRLTERLLDPMGLYRKYIHAELNHTVETDGAFFVALDSTAPRRTITNGRIDAEQLAFCTEAFSQAPQGALRVVVAHHPFTSAPDYARDRMMPHRKRTLQHFTDLGVDMILGGHLHRAYVGNSLDTLDLERTRGIVIAQSGTTTSGRGRAREKKKNTFNLITVSRETICVQHYVFSATDDRFQPFAQHLFPRHGFPFAPG